MAAYTAAFKVDSFAEMSALNLGHAMTNFTAQNYEAKKIDRVIKGGKSALVRRADNSLSVFQTYYRKIGRAPFRLYQRAGRIDAEA